jgi:DmsE family decaheme c-type cytochrome
MRVSLIRITVKRSIFVIFLLFIFIPLCYLSAQEKTEPERAGDKICAECHDEVAEKFEKNIHAKNEKVKGFVCVSCHGPCKKHVEDNDVESIYHPREDFLRTGKNPCLDCHQGDMFNSADKSSHSEVANGCCDCHTVHSNKKTLLKTSTKKLCFECHKDVYAKFRLTSHHPVVEGLMTCKSCHPVHGGAAKFTFDGSNNELCLSCHNSKEGPFVYEHEPVNEDCSICHDPHGTVANNLLVQNEPALCMSCHPMHFHTSLTAYIGKFVTPLDSSRGGVSTKDGMKKAMLTKCTQCHDKIHGTDLGSQSLSSLGKSLTRN